ncbi:hypothetical protein CP533_2632 [Ophiocordyceps camponoti-saundersi (nom. inval.)]|nr:hypothetical protein CP533_2632 [Ophiocordyceps camponoti-saundersi (nom. inval.)]
MPEKKLLYDLDYEADRLVLVQGLMLMTYWYETPDDQKDTWHWMGVAVSLAHTIGLHRDPSRTTMTLERQRLCKRVWWSCVMRDRLIALGMRRPTRIKDEDFDVPMLTEADFAVEDAGLEPDRDSEEPPEVDPASALSCPAVADPVIRRQLAQLCVAKAQLCLCIGHMLKAQYSFMLRREPHKTTNSTMMLFPLSPQPDDVASVDAELHDWLVSLPAACQARPLVNVVDDGADGAAVAVQRTLLHMFYHTTVAALHRPQFLLAGAASKPSEDMARLKVRNAAGQITRMAAQLHSLHLDRFLPTTAVTVLLPAMMVHLLDMKNPGGPTRHRAVRGFRQCMRVIEKLRDMYTAADYATGFLDAALRKAAIDVAAAAAVDFSAGAGSPPHTDPLDSADMTTTTPSASGGSDAVLPLNIDFDPMMLGPDEFDWNAMAGADFDVDQWLQFPPDNVVGGGGGGGGGGDEAGDGTTTIIGLDGSDMINTDGLDGGIAINDDDDDDDANDEDEDDDDDINLVVQPEERDQ